MGPDDVEAEREVRAAVAAVERALDRVRRTRQGASRLDVQAVRDALDDAERWLQRAQQRLKRAREQAANPGCSAAPGDDGE